MKIPVYQPDLAGNEKKYVDECLDTTWISSKGKFVGEFEKKFAEYTGSKYAITVSNGTVALHLALMALDISTGDEVIVPSFTYIATVNAIAYTGATPVFVDSLKDTWQIDPADIERKITSKTRALMLVHLYGHPCDMDAIMAIAKKHDLLVIEDCAEAFGARYKGIHVGNFGDIAAYSFFGNKTITCGEGGMVVTNNKVLYEQAALIKNQGVSPYRQYWHDVLGYNYRMTNIAAAIGLAQLERADEFIAKKRQIAMWYKEKLKKTPVVFHDETKDIVHSFWMCSILTRDEDECEQLRKKLADAGVETRPLFYPANVLPMYAHPYQKFEVAEYLAYKGMNLPSWPNLTEKEIDYICDVIINFYK